MILKLGPVPGVGFPCLACGKALGVGSGSVLPPKTRITEWLTPALARLVTWALVLSLSGRSMPRSAFSLCSSSCAVLTTRGLALSSSFAARLSLLGPSSSASCSLRPFLMPPPPSAAYLNGAVTKQGLLQADTKTRAGWVAAGRQVRTSIGHWLPHFLTAALKDSHPLL